MYFEKYHKNFQRKRNAKPLKTKPVKLTHHSHVKIIEGSGKKATSNHHISNGKWIFWAKMKFLYIYSIGKLLRIGLKCARHARLMILLLVFIYFLNWLLCLVHIVSYQCAVIAAITASWCCFNLCTATAWLCRFGFLSDFELSWNVFVAVI